MSLDDVLNEIIECLSAQYDGVIGWEQVRWWPKDAIEIFRNAGWMDAATSADSTECPECQEGGFSPVNPRMSPDGQLVAAYAVACHVHGFVNIPPQQLRQWRIAEGQIAQWLAKSLNLKGKVEKDGAMNAFRLGTVQGNKRQAELYLDLNSPASVKASGHSLSLREIIFIENGKPTIDRPAILTMIDLPPRAMSKVAKIAKQRDKQPQNVGHKEELEVGSREWRKQNAKAAAHARHSKPGGSRDKQDRIRAAWASGKYTTRDICAEQECAALDMSFAAARKALRNQPDPKRSA